MIFIANVLTMNGGTTFLVRACRELKRQGETATVLLLINRSDGPTRESLNEVANVIVLKDFLRDRGRFFRSHLGLFGMVDWTKLVAALGDSTPHIHVMGSFGFIFARRLAHHLPSLTLTAGVYHQNEFMFQKLPWFLTREIQADFGALTPNNTVFFNNSSRDNYAHFFGNDYTKAPVLPIGVEISNAPMVPEPVSSPPRIVSIGNLVPFKTYNKHIITVLAALKPKYSDLSYEICGSGSERQALQDYAKRQNVAESVHFKGTIPYKEFSKHVQGATVFVGSGTALIEAAHLGVPALIGIESINEPETYGFLHHIDGFSYNEDNIGHPKSLLQTHIEDVLKDAGYRDEVSQGCRMKAKEFSIRHTMNGFLRIKGQPANALRPIRWFTNIRLLMSLIAVALAEKATGKKSFSNRRSQSY
jgi:1,2-diacylglycerol 3-alpha-glucosyltransferase